MNEMIRDLTGYFPVLRLGKNHEKKIRKSHKKYVTFIHHISSNFSGRECKT